MGVRDQTGAGPEGWLEAGRQFWSSWFDQAPDIGSEQGRQDALTRFNDLYWDAWEKTLGRLLESPDLGHTREITERQGKVLQAWVELRRVSFEYQMLLGEAYSRASAEFAASMATRTEAGLPAPGMQELLGVWGKAVDKVMTEVFATEPFARTQGRLLSAAMAYRQAERGVAELFLDGAHVPTRTEMDNANRTIHELRREVRQLKKTVEAMARPAPSRRGPKA